MYPYPSPVTIGKGTPSKSYAYITSAQYNPLWTPAPYDYIYLAGKKSPGLVKLSGWERANKWDVKEGRGAYGSVTTFVTLPPARGKLQFFLWEDTHFAEWQTFRKAFAYNPTKRKIYALAIYHPTLADLGISTVVCESISALENDGNGLWTCTASMLEYLPPPKVSAISTPALSKTDTPTGPGIPPALSSAVDDLAKELEKARAP